MNKIINICSNKCFGQDNYHGSCCRLEERDFIIGPITDPQGFLQRLSQHFNRSILYKDIFIDYEEGKKLFPNRTNWQNPQSYPALRVNLNTKDLSCIFYNNTIRACSVYTIRPAICRTFFCDYLKEKLDNENLD